MGARRIWLRFFKRSNRAPRATVDPSKPGLLRAESSFPAEFATQHSRLFAVAQRVRRAPQNRLGTASRRAPFCASSIKAQRARRAPPSRPETASRRAPFCASSIKAQRARRAPPSRPETASRALRFARVPQRRKGRGAHHQAGQELPRARSVLREFLKGAKGAARTTKQARNCLARAPFCASSLKAQRVRRAPQNRLGTALRRAPRSVLRVSDYAETDATSPS